MEYVIEFIMDEPVKSFFIYWLLCGAYATFATRKYLFDLERHLDNILLAIFLFAIAFIFPVSWLLTWSKKVFAKEER
jgi:hypothetical protein